MKAIQPYLDGIIEGAQSALDGLIDTIISTFWNTISPALSPLPRNSLFYSESQVSLLQGFKPTDKDTKAARPNPLPS